MDHTPEPAAAHDGARAHEEHHRDVEVHVRRAPKYGVFMAIGAVLGALVAWLASALQPAAVGEGGQPIDTTPVIGLVVVGGLVVGAALGGVVALLADRALARRGRTVTAEQTDVEELEEAAPRVGAGPDGAMRDEGPADAGEAAFEHLEQPGANPCDPGRPAVLPADDRDAERRDELPRDWPQAHDRPEAHDGPEERDRPTGA